MSAKIITQKRLKELLHYEPATGVFTWLVRVAHCVQIGDVAGFLHHTGYIRIVVDYRSYKAHRLAFLYMEGKWPIDQVDHDDHIGSNNRWKNLNQATYETNSKNKSMRNNNTSGVTGVNWDKSHSKWQAQIMANGKKKHLGRFTAIEDAIAARKAADIEYGYHENHGARR